MATQPGRKRLRAVSGDRAKLLRERRVIERRHHGPFRCHWPEGCTQAATEHHETVRRSQYREGAADVDVMVPLCRTHHDWVGDHPAEAHDRYRLSIPRWELDQRRSACAKVSPTDADFTTGGAMPRPDRGREQLCVRLDPEDMAFIRQAAEDRHITPPEALRRLVTASRRLAEQPSTTTTITGRKRGPVPKKQS